MAMMDVREMMMSVSHFLMLMRVTMGLFTIPIKVMLVLMMLIMVMHMLMEEPFVRVNMVMNFCKVNPDPGCH